LTIPTEGVGGRWIVKLPSMQYPGMPENEFSFISIAAKMGMDMPDGQLTSLDDIAGLPEGIGRPEGAALAVRRLDRSVDGAVHMEDFAQVFGVFPDEKYETRTYRSIAKAINIQVGVDGLQEMSGGWSSARSLATRTCI
jgi:serine/threonine-protein kinase HipA